MMPFDQIAAKIVQEQEHIIGPIAWTEAAKVNGLEIISQTKEEISVSASDPKDVINRLVGQYEHLFGRASQEVCREAVASMLTDLSPSEIPSSLVA